MSEYKLEIMGNNDLAQINLQIAGEEKGASIFKNSTVKAINNQVSNEVTFETLPAGNIPKLLTIVISNTPAPPATKKVWDGVMVVSGTNTAVAAYRTS